MQNSSLLSPLPRSLPPSSAQIVTSEEGINLVDEGEGGMKRLMLLWKMVHSTLDINNGALASHYISQMRALAEHYEIGIPTSIRIKFCSYCSSFFIPSVNCNVRITTKKHLNEEEHKLLSLFLKEEERNDKKTLQKRKVNVKNVVRYHCNNCNQVSVFPGTENGFISTHLHSANINSSSKINSPSKSTTKSTPKSIPNPTKTINSKSLSSLSLNQNRPTSIKTLKSLAITKEEPSKPKKRKQKQIIPLKTKSTSGLNSFMASLQNSSIYSQIKKK